MNKKDNRLVKLRKKLKKISSDTNKKDFNYINRNIATKDDAKEILDAAYGVIGHHLLCEYKRMDDELEWEAEDTRYFVGMC